MRDNGNCASDAPLDFVHEKVLSDVRAGWINIMVTEDASNIGDGFCG